VYSFHVAAINRLSLCWYSYQFVRNDDLRRLTKQPKLTAIIQSCRLTLFGHIMCMDDNADAKRILLASPPADWRRQLGHPHITWLSTVQQDLKQHHLTLPRSSRFGSELSSVEDDVDIWRYAIIRVACQKRRQWYTACDSCQSLYVMDDWQVAPIEAWADLPAQFMYGIWHVCDWLQRADGSGEDR